jgi:hypothetical protein
MWHVLHETTYVTWHPSECRTETFKPSSTYASELRHIIDKNTYAKDILVNVSFKNEEQTTRDTKNVSEEQ